MRGKRFWLVVGIGLLLILALVVCSCSGNGAVVKPTPTPTPIADGEEPPIDRTWISPGKVMVGNFYAGAQAEYPIKVHNGRSETTMFEVKYRYPDNVDSGYSFPTSQVQDWVIIADETPVLAPYETREILVTLAMPNGAVSPGDKWEFWVSVVDKGQTGMVVTELCSRWLISMR